MTDQPNTVKEIRQRKENAEEERDKAYKERNQLVFNKLRYYDKLGIQVGWKIDVQNAESSYNIIYVLEQEHSFFGHIGQMGWHVHEDELDPENVDWLNPINQEYDGHSDVQKYNRLRKLDRKIMNTTYLMSETHLINAVSELAGARGEVEGIARAKQTFGNEEDQSNVEGLKTIAKNIGKQVENLVDLQSRQYRRIEE